MAGKGKTHNPELHQVEGKKAYKIQHFITLPEKGGYGGLHALSGTRERGPEERGQDWVSQRNSPSSFLLRKVRALTENTGGVYQS